jgi:hypothetical protein
MPGDLPSPAALHAALAAADAVHEEYERVALKGVADMAWAGFFAAFVLGRVGDFAEASRLAELLEEVESDDDWLAAAAEHVLMKLRS